MVSRVSMVVDGGEYEIEEENLWVSFVLGESKLGDLGVLKFQSVTDLVSKSKQAKFGDTSVIGAYWIIDEPIRTWVNMSFERETGKWNERKEDTCPSTFWFIR